MLTLGWRGAVQQGVVWHGAARLGMVRLARRVAVWYGAVRQGRVRSGMVWLDSAGMVRLARRGSVWLGEARYDLAGKARFKEFLKGFIVNGL